MDCQDWEPVVLKKSLTASEINKIKSSKNSKTENLLNDDSIISKAKKTDVKSQVSMMQTRVALGYKTQKDLANATKGKISVSRINEIENGKGTSPSGNEKTILFKLLKIKF